MRNRRFWCRALLTVATVQFIWSCIHRDSPVPSAHFSAARSLVNGGCDLRDDSALPSELASTIERIVSQPTLLQQPFQRDFVDIDGDVTLGHTLAVCTIAVFPHARCNYLLAFIS